MKFPKVTVLMPVYNGEKYLRQAIESILSQTFTDYEFLIINDGSTDRSVEIIQSYDDPRIRIVHNERNYNIINTLNKGLKLSKGEYIARMDCDDISLPHRLKKQVDFMERETEIGLCGSWLVHFSDIAERIWKVPSNDVEIRCEMLFNSVLYHPTVMIRKIILDKYELWYEDFLHAEDYALWLRIMEQCKVANIPEVLVRYRQHAHQIVNLYSDQKMKSADRVRRLQLKALGIIPTEREMMIHHNLSYNIPAKDVKDLIEVQNWLLKLVDKNLAVRNYDPLVFNAMIHKKWFWTCNTLTHLGLDIWKQYRNSPVSQIYYLSVLQEIKFFVKSLLCYSKQKNTLNGYS
jgi:glycosyltransferase involved in cell wall biosynthesis